MDVLASEQILEKRLGYEQRALADRGRPVAHPHGLPAPPRRKTRSSIFSTQAWLFCRSLPPVAIGVYRVFRGMICSESPWFDPARSLY